MKPFRITPLLLTALGSAVLLSSCAKKETVVVAPAVSPSPGMPAPSRAVPAPIQPMARPALVVNDLAASSWTDIKDLTYDQRSDFITGLGRLQNKLDGQISALNAKRATMTTDTKDWDFAMKGLLEAQAYLRSMTDEMSHATPDSWIQEKEKVEEAWHNSQEAYDRVINSTAAS
jgi:hypothetical protein